MKKITSFVEEVEYPKKKKIKTMYTGSSENYRGWGEWGQKDSPGPINAKSTLTEFADDMVQASKDPYSRIGVIVIIACIIGIFWVLFRAALPPIYSEDAISDCGDKIIDKYFPEKIILYEIQEEGSSKGMLQFSADDNPGNPFDVMHCDIRKGVYPEDVNDYYGTCSFSTPKYSGTIESLEYLPSNDHFRDILPGKPGYVHNLPVKEFLIKDVSFENCS